MYRTVVMAALTLVMLLTLAIPAMAVTPANEGMGKMYGEHISGEAKAGMLGKCLNPGMHHGMSGWMMPG